MNKNKKMFIITITFLMLIGLTTITATNIDTNDTTTITDTTTTQTTPDTTTQTNTINYDTTSTNEASTSQSNNIQKTTNTQETINNKNVEKTQNLKADRTETANTFSDLNSYLTSNAYDTVTLNIGDDIELAGSIRVNNAIKTLTINGNQKTINGMGQYRFLQIPNATTVIIDNIIVTNCKITGNGGVIVGQSNSVITIQNSNLTYNNANYGGALYVDQGTMIIINTTLAYNNAISRGGAIQNNQGNLTINNSTLIYNNAGDLGGAIFNNANLTIDNSNLNNNSANDGGAITNYAGKINITNSNITHNEALRQAGAIFNNGGNLTTTNSNITYNRASTQAGAIFNNGGNLTTINSNITYNRASTQAGAIFNNKGNLTTINSNITYNQASTNGGAISNTLGTITINSTNLNNNNATTGGAIFNNGNITITDSNLNNNMVLQESDLSRGGAIYSNNGGNLAINASNLTNNYAGYNGGAIFFGYGILTIDYSNLTNNTAKIHGGAIYSGYTNLTVNNSNLSYNNVTASGGAIHNNFGNVTLNNNIMNNNNATQGGAILSNEGDVTITNNTMNNNNATQGGAIHNKQTNLTILDSTFDNNSANGTGGVIYSNTTTEELILKNSNITNNYVTNNRGYVVDFANSNSITITDNTFINNTDNTRDMLFSDAKTGAEVDIHDNTYTDNYLEYSTIKPNVTVVTNNEAEIYDYDVDVVLRSIYDDTVCNGTMNIYVNGYLVNSTNVTNGHSKIFINNSDLTKRENNITLEYISQSKHYQNTTTNFTVKKEINTTLSVQAPSEMKAGESAVINFTLKDSEGNPLSGETIHVLVDEEQVAVLTTDEDGVVSYPFDAFGDETVRIEATHHTGSDSFYLSSMDAEIDIRVNKIKQEMVIVPGNITPDVESNVTIRLFDEGGYPIKNKTLTVNITEEGKPDITGTVTTDENGIAVFNFTPVDEGMLNITVTSPGDDIYHEYSESVEASKDYITTNLIVTASDTPINQTNTINIKVEPSMAFLSGTVELNISGEVHNVTVTNGIATYHDYKSSTAGQKNITAKFISSTPGYANATVTDDFEVTKLLTRVTIEAVNRTAGNVTLKVSVFPKDDIESVIDGGNIVIESVDGENRTVIYNDKLVNGELIYLTDVNETGWYEFETEYYGNDYFDGEVNTTESIEVLLMNTNVTVFDKVALVGDTIILNATVTDENGNPVNDGNVTFIIDGTPIEAQLENGIATTEYTLPATLTSGNYTITANYAGNNKYNISSGQAKLSIDSKETSIGVTPLNNTKGNTTIEVTLNSTTDDKPIPNAEIIIKDVNGTQIGEGITDENGTAIIHLDLPVGDNNITVTYSGDDTYSPQEETVPINVIPRDSETTGTLANNTVGNVTVDVEVVDPVTGEPVTGPVRIIVDGEVVGNGTLDDEGKATIPVDIDKKGNYTFTVEYEGNDDYKASNDTMDDVSIVGRDVGMDVVAENPTVENTTLNVTITDPETNKTIPNATVIVTLPNGTNVTGTTDENGTALIPVDLPSGDNNITITYPGDDEHEAEQQNITVKVKSYTVVTVDPVVGVVWDNVTFTANVRDYQDNPVTGGYVQFNVGGKTLKDENGKNIRVFVENGIAKLSYKAESGWLVDSHPNLKVQAVYTGTSIAIANRSDTSKVTIYKRNATVTVSAPDDYVNGTLHIDAVVRDQNGSLINGGNLVFKLNGLSVKDENNKAIVAQVVNGKVHLDVKLPFAYSAKKYNLTAVYSNKIYNKVNTTNTTTLKAIPTYVNYTVTIKDQFSKPVIKGQIYNKFNNAILEGTAIINIKFDGISYAKKVKIQNGTFTETLEGIPIYKPGTHKVEIAAGANSHYEAARKTITSKTTPKYNVNTVITNITRNKTTTRVQAKIVDDKNKNVQKDLRITIKLNGKSFLINKTVTNGKVDVLVDTSTLKNRTYNLEIVSGANTYYNAGKATAELPKY